MSGCSSSTPPKTDSLSRASLRVLIVADEPGDVAMIRLTLKSATIAFTDTVTATLDHCRQLLQTQDWDVVLADYRLPGFTAYEVLEALRQSKQMIPLILVTESLGEEAAIECLKAGMTDYVLKDRLCRLPMVLERSLQEVALKRQQQLATAQSHQQAQREAMISRIVQAMRETLILDAVLQTTVDLLHEALQLKRCLILRPNNTNTMVVSQISEATRDRDDLTGIQCSIVDYYQAQLAQGDVVRFADVRVLPNEALQKLVAQFSIGALLSAPLRYQQNLLGTICLQHERPYDWTDDEVSLVQAIANQCAIAIHQAQLFEQVQQQARREQLLNQINRTISSSLDTNVILQEIVQLTGECFQVDRVVIFTLNGTHVQVTHEWLMSDQIPSMLDFTTVVSEFPAMIDPITGDFARSVFHVPDYEALTPTTARLDLLHKRQTRSLLSVPIFFRDEFLGGLDLYTTTTHRQFSQDEIDLLQRIADQAAIALYNAQSYERLEQTVRLRTRELEAEKRLSDAANRAKSEFLANMSHELRTPLTGILGFSSVLLKQIFGPLNEKQQQYIENIAHCGEHLLDLINDLLDLTKIEAGREALVFDEIDIQEFCKSCMAMISEQAEAQGLQLSLAIAPGINTWIADHRRLKQILFNLLSNAVKFTPQGSVTLTVVMDAHPAPPPSEQSIVKTQLPDCLTFSVIDTGIGIAPSDIPLLFQPFQQLDGGLDRKYQGTGLGLTLARKLAQLHGGDITVTTAPGQGSCFRLYLPQPQ